MAKMPGSSALGAGSELPGSRSTAFKKEFRDLRISLPGIARARFGSVGPAFPPGKPGLHYPARRWIANLVLWRRWLQQTERCCVCFTL